MEANDVAVPAAKPARASGGRPRERRRMPLRTAAPTITGRATVRESMFECCRVKPRQRAAVRVAPFRETPGARAAACASPRASPSIAVALPLSRTWGRRSAITIAAAPASSPIAVGRGPPRYRSIGRSRATPQSTGGRNDRPRTVALRRSKERSSSAITRRWPTSSAAAAPACSATSKLFCSSGSRPSSSQPASQGIKVRWAELETGSSSVGPCTAPRTIALDRLISPLWRVRRVPADA